MINFQGNTNIYVGLFLLLCSMAIILIPPKFGNAFYGIFTKWTMKNETTWAVGQKLFAVAILLIGLICLIVGSLKIREAIPPFAMLVVIFGLWYVSKYFIHLILRNKYPNV